MTTNAPVSRSQILEDALRTLSHPRFATATFAHSVAIDRPKNALTFVVHINGGVDREHPEFWLSLLKRYIQHVTQCEGTAFLSDGNQTQATKPFTPIEWGYLLHAEAEMYAEGGPWQRDPHQLALDVRLDEL